MSSGGKSKVKYAQSPEAAAIMNAMLPLYTGMGKYGSERYFGGSPQMGAPSMAGVLTTQPMYNIPSPSLMMPTADWWGSLDPGVKAGLYAPYMEAGQGMLELMGSRGQTGGAGTGYTGAAGAAIGELAGEAAKNVGLSAWKMTAPGAMTAWNADLQRNMTAYGNQQQERMADYNTEMEVWRRPMQAMGYGQMGMSQPYYMPQQNTMGNMFSGGMMGGLGFGMAGFNPWLGAGLGALGGLFS